VSKKQGNPLTYAGLKAQYGGATRKGKEGRQLSGFAQARPLYGASWCQRSDNEEFGFLSGQGGADCTGNRRNDAAGGGARPPEAER